MAQQEIKNRKLLLVDDQPELLDMVKGILEEEGYRNIQTASAVKEGLSLWRSWQPELAVLDVMLPDGDGFSLLTQARRFSDIPVLFLTARGEDEDRCRGLGMGADDYMVKPVDLDELLLRIEALLRRSKIAHARRIEIGSLILDADEHTAYVNGEEVLLTVREFNIVYKLLSYPKKTFTRSQLMDEFWGVETDTSLRAVDVYVTKLRDKLSACDGFKIVTVRGLGYKVVLQ